MFTYKKESSKMVKNPMFEAMLDYEQFLEKNRQFDENLNWQKEKFSKDQEAAAEKARREAASGAGGNSQFPFGGTPTNLGDVSGDADFGSPIQVEAQLSREITDAVYGPNGMYAMLYESAKSEQDGVGVNYIAHLIEKL